MRAASRERKSIILSCPQRFRRGLPYPAHRLINRDHINVNLRLRLGKPIFRLELDALRVEQGEKIDQPFAVLQLRQGGCAL